MGSAWTIVELREEVGAPLTEVMEALDQLVILQLVEFRSAPLALAGYYLTKGGAEKLREE